MRKSIACLIALSCSLHSVMLSPPTCQSDFSAELDFFYGSIDPRVVSVGRFELTPVQNTSSIDQKLYQALPDWNSGVKAALGYSFCDAWTFETDYTYFRTGLTKSYVGFIDYTVGNTGIDYEPGFGLLQLFNGVVYPKTTFKGSWSYNQLDFLFNRAFCAGSNFLLSPFAGIKWIFLNQNLHTHSLGSSSHLRGTFVDNKVLQRYNGVGATFGMKSQWNLYCGLSLYAEGSFSLLYARHHLVWKEVNDFDLPNINCDFHLRELNYALESGLGLLWSEHLFGSRLELKAGYEWHYLSDITKVPSPLNAPVSPISDIPSNPLTLQGLVIGVRFVI